MNLAQSVVQALSAMRLAGLRDYGLVTEQDLGAMTKVWVGGLGKLGIDAELVQRTAVSFSVGHDHRSSDRAGTFPSLPEFVAEAKRLLESEFVSIGVPVEGQDNTVRIVRVKRGEVIPSVSPGPMALPGAQQGRTLGDALEAARVRRMAAQNPEEDARRRAVIEQERRAL